MSLNSWIVRMRWSRKSIFPLKCRGVNVLLNVPRNWVNFDPSALYFRRLCCSIVSYFSRLVVFDACDILHIQWLQSYWRDTTVIYPNSSGSCWQNKRGVGVISAITDALWIWLQLEKNQPQPADRRATTNIARFFSNVGVFCTRTCILSPSNYAVIMPNERALIHSVRERRCYWVKSITMVEEWRDADAERLAARSVENGTLFFLTPLPFLFLLIKHPGRFIYMLMCVCVCSHACLPVGVRDLQLPAMFWRSNIPSPPWDWLPSFPPLHTPLKSSWRFTAPSNRASLPWVLCV